MLPAWLAAITMAPHPVTVRTLLFVPLRDPGPEIMLNRTGLPEAPPVALNVIGATPEYTGDAGCGKVMVCEASKPVSWIPCTAPVTFRLLSVNSTSPLKLPFMVGSKSNAMVQLVPPASSKAADELAVVCLQVEDGAQSKLADTLGFSPVAGKGNMRAALPTFSTVTVIGLSVLVAPTVRLGGSANSSFNTKLLFQSAI